MWSIWGKNELTKLAKLLHVNLNFQKYLSYETYFIFQLPATPHSWCTYLIYRYRVFISSLHIHWRIQGACACSRFPPPPLEVKNLFVLIFNVKLINASNTCENVHLKCTRAPCRFLNMPLYKYIHGINNLSKRLGYFAFSETNYDITLK